MTRARILCSGLPLLLVAIATMSAKAPPADALELAAPAWSLVGVTGPTVVPPVSDEIQNVFVDAEGATFTLSFNGQTTPALPFDIEAPQLEAALDSLSTIGGAGGEVTVVGGPGGKGATKPYGITFGGAFEETNVQSLVTDGSNLTGASHSVTVTTPVDGGPGTATLAIYAHNVGGQEAAGTVTVTAELPANVVINGSSVGEGWSCTGKAGQAKVVCKSHEPVAASLVTNSITVPIRATGGIPGTEEAILTISGGGAEPETYSAPITVSAIPATPGIRAFQAGAYGADGRLSVQAGAHPFTASAAIFVNTIRAPNGHVVPAGEPRTIKVDLPPGFLGNPTATPTCEPEVCPETTDPIVGIADPLVQTFGANGAPASVHNVLKPYGSPGKFEFVLISEHVNALGNLRSDEDYGLTVESPNTPQVYPVFGTFFTFWGVPADPVHTPQRCLFPEVHTGCAPSTAPNTAFLTNPTDCAGEAVTPPTTGLGLDTWLLPGIFSNISTPLPPVTGCDQLHLEAEFKFEPSSTASDSPASFHTELSVPSEGLTDPEKLATPELKKTVIELPEGVDLNAAGADGLQACTEQQIGFKGAGFPMPNPMRFDKEPNQCPDASKIGTGELTSPLLAEPLQGNLYLAAQGPGNPFGSLLALYLVIEDPASGIVIKLPGRVDLDPRTGKVTVTLENLPQLPFANLKLDLKGGNRSALATPTTCGQFTTTTEMTPWSAPESGPPLQTTDSFKVSGDCASSPGSRPFSPSFEAGTQSTLGGAYSALVVKVARKDGEQELTSLDFTLPKGLIGKLAGIPYCSDAAIASAENETGREELANSSCPAASRLGTVDTSAGVGSEPFHVAGHLYLAGPYKGAPVSSVAITPAVAGPFDLGNVIVRAPLYINPESAQLTAKTDPIPTILKGIPLKLRSVTINVDRPNFTINPTSCEPMNASASLGGSSGATAAPSNRFQVGGCSSLKFSPKLKLALKGGTRRNSNPALTATLTQPAGQAGIGRVSVALPHSEFLDQSHIRTICTRVQFAANECPKAAIYGEAEAISPLLDQPLSGPVYLRSSSHKLPDLVVALKGPASQPIEIDLDGRIDAIHGGIRNTFELLPDAPISKFVLRMQGGKKGLLVNSTNICRGTHKATVKMEGQNGKLASSSPSLTGQCK